MTIATLTDSSKAFLCAYFSSQPDGSKLKYGTDLSQIDESFAQLSPPAYQLKNSVIKLNGKLYLIDKGAGALIGTGAYGKVKYARALDETELTALKIELKNSNHQQKEGKIVYDLNLSRGKVKRPDKEKYYIPMPYLGQSLYDYLKAPLTFDERFSIAIELCSQVSRLHTGKLSNTATPYAHRDIKPENITINQQKKLTLVDFGLAEKKPEAKNYYSFGSPVYMAKAGRFITPGEEITNQQHDLLALRRTLFMPNSFVFINGRRRSFTSIFTDWPMVLTAEMLRLYELCPYIDTGCAPDENEDNANINFNATHIGAILVLASLNILPLHYSSVERDESLAKTIMLFYQNYKDRPDRLREKINSLLTFFKSREEKERQESLSLLFDADIIHGFKDASHHQDFINALKNANTQKKRLALGILYKLDLTHTDDFSKILNSDELATWVISISKKNQLSTLYNVFSRASLYRSVQSLIAANLEDEFIDVYKKTEKVIPFLERSQDALLTKALILLAKQNINSRTFFSRLIEPYKKDSFFFKANPSTLNAVLFLDTLNLNTLFQWGLINGNDDILNRIESFSKSIYCANDIKKHLRDCLLVISTNESYTKMIEECGTFDVKIMMLMKLISLGISGQKILQPIASDDAFIGQYFCLFNNPAYSDLSIINVMLNQQAKDAFKLCKKNYLSDEATERIIKSDKLTKKLLSINPKQLNISSIISLAYETYSMKFFLPVREITHDNDKAEEKVLAI